MTRWPADARERLERAAIELFTEKGFAETTVPEITARAGLTTRTFFRHFADKREVLFAGDEMPRLAVDLIASAPPSREPWDLILGGLKNVSETRFDPRREEITLRRQIIRSDDALVERDLRKRAALSETIRSGLAERGVPRRTAGLLAESTVTVLYAAVDEWLEQDRDQPLYEIILDTLGVLRDVLNGNVESRRSR
jgi:AcrR family transcriptional regulator